MNLPTINHTQAEVIGGELRGFLQRMLRDDQVLPFAEFDLVWSDAVQHVLREARELIEGETLAAEIAGGALAAGFTI